MTYPKMNAEIVGLLRSGTTPVDKYAADRIEELERQRDGLLKKANMLALSLPDSELNLAREVWGNTNVAVVAHWRDELKAAIAPIIAPDMPDVT